MDEWYNVRYDGTDLDDGKAAVSITLASSGSTVTYSGSDISKFFSAKDGQYRISFVPTVSGGARLSVVLNGDEVVDQTTQRPWEIPVRAGEADAAKSSAYGTGASRALAGMEARFNVRLADAFDNTCEDSKVEDISLEFALVGSGPSLNAMTSSVVTTELGGHFIIVYTPPTHAEDYTIGVKVKLGTVSIQDLQVKVHKEAGEVDYASTVVTTATGAALESFTTSETSAGVAFSVYFQLVDASGVYVLDSPQADGWLQVTAVPPVKQTPWQRSLLATTRRTSWQRNWATTGSSLRPVGSTWASPVASLRPNTTSPWSQVGPRRRSGRSTPSTAPPWWPGSHSPSS